ncbi:hypothetical protein BOX15_Mlig020488g1 [Macrostomum lignano]|uniref:Uncharacterized protein n=1 Tax=Macrostomum lignano TaxID=282301 RepID=A0A267GRW0_9PLAT|nr:hypothetical protein BOX15_Mlig020488g1 [Macrostomum lignano]
MDPQRGALSTQNNNNNSHLIQHPTIGKRPSRFKPVRFQEYRMQWGGCSSLSSMAISVSDVYVLDPECPALAAAAAATKLDDVDIDNRSRMARNSSRLPSDAELAAKVEAAAANAAANCGCRRRFCGDAAAHHQRHWSEDDCDLPGDNYGVGDVVWTLQPSSSFVHETRCPRRSTARFGAQNQKRQLQRMRQQQLRSGWASQTRPLLLQTESRPRANSAFSTVETRAGTSKPPPSSPSGLPSPHLQSELPAPPPALEQTPPAPPPPPPLPPPPPSDLPALKTVSSTTTATTTASITSPTNSDEPSSTSGVGSAESCAESCVATVAQVLQDALLAAVRAETEPLERQLAEKDAEVRHLRQELQDRDARLRRLNRLLTCRRMLMLDDIQQHQQLEGGGGTGRSAGSKNGRGRVSNSASTSALSSLL